jgi:serine/threonine protein kinase
MLTKIKHPNIVEFLGSYSQHGLHNLLFPFVDMDLSHLLLEKPCLEQDVIYRNIYGLADALSNVHQFNFKDKDLEISKIGYHHDLRPANILVKGAVFMIADFGLSKLKSDTETSKSQLRGGHDDYLGPESFNETDWENQSVGRALDVWAFGCVVAEIATYIEGRSVVEFRQKRKCVHGRGNILTTDHAFHLDGKLKPAVDTWLQEISQNPKDEQIPQLVVSASELLNPNSRTRINISLATTKFAKLAKESKIESILSAFRCVSYELGKRTARENTLVLLEQKRFEAWIWSSNLLTQNQKSDTINPTLDCLDHLKGALREFEKDQMSVMNDETASRHPTWDSFKRICNAIDVLCSKLPANGLVDMEKAWSKAVVEIEDMEALNAIRSAPKPERYRSVGIKATIWTPAVSTWKTSNSKLLQPLRMCSGLKTDLKQLAFSLAWKARERF